MRLAGAQHVKLLKLWLDKGGKVKRSYLPWVWEERLAAIGWPLGKRIEIPRILAPTQKVLVPCGREAVVDVHAQDLSLAVAPPSQRR